MRGREGTAAALSAAAGLVAELLQTFTTREPSGRDFTLDLAGIALAWSGVVCWRRRRLFRLGHALVVVACAVATGWLIAREVAIRRDLARMMPLLAGFEHSWELDRWHAKPGTTMRRSRADPIRGEWSLEVRCSATEAYPGVSMEDFEEDWRPYRWLEWSARLPSKEPIQLAVRIDDDQGARFGTRYTTYVATVPSEQVYRIDLRDVAMNFREHPMNLGRITELHFFLDEPETPHSFILDEVRLVREEPP
jgi:hypothetical protein